MQGIIKMQAEWIAFKSLLDRLFTDEPALSSKCLKS